MTDIEEDIQFKKVTEADYDAIMDIREDVHQEDPYLTAQFHKMLKYHKGYAALVNNKMIGFHFGVAIDDGSSILLQSGRVRKEFEGKGVFSMIYNYTLEQIRKDEDRAIRCMAVPINKAVCKFLIRRGARLAFERKQTSSIVSTQKFQRLLGDAEQHDPSLTTLSIKDIKFLLQNESLRDEYLSNQRMFIDWVPYRPIESNLECYSFEDFHCLMSNRAAMLSFCCSYHSATGQHINIDFLGRSNDLSEIRKHIFQHVCKYICPDSKTFALYISNNASFDTESLTRELEISFGAQRIKILTMPVLETSLKSF